MFDSNLNFINEFEPMVSYGGNQRLLFDALLACLRQDSQGNTAVWDALFISTAKGDNLDDHGVVFGLARSAGESDTDYRARLLVVLRSRAIVGTPEAIHDAVEAALGERDCGVIYLKDRVAMEQGGEPICPIGSITAPPDMSLYAYLLYLIPGHDTTDVDLLVAQLEQSAPLRDSIVICEVDAVTPEQLIGTATASSYLSSSYLPARAIDGNLGAPTGYSSFYWAVVDMPTATNTPWWRVDVTDGKLVDLIMIAQEARTITKRLGDIRITLTPPADCDVPELVYRVCLPDVGVGNYDRWFFPLPRPTWVGAVKIEILSLYGSQPYHGIAEIELYSPDDWTRTTLRRIN